MRIQQLAITLAPLALLSPIAGQIVKYASSPAGSEFQAGNSANTFPMRGLSASYQQIHDSADMRVLNGGRPMILSGMHFRPARAYAIPARKFDVQITLSVTQVTAATMSRTFASNLGSKSTIVLPYTSMNLPAGVGKNGNPNKPLWRFPFKNIFVYTASTGNICWDWRHKNSNAYATTYMDFVSGTSSSVPVIGSGGTGCTATGQTVPATANLTASSTNLFAQLNNGRAGSASVLSLGLARSPAPLWCGTLYSAPLVMVFGSTNASGSWTAGTFPASTLSFQPYAEITMQYAFADSKLVGGVGLSNYAVGAPPAHRGKYVSRVWLLGNAAGFEKGTSGSVGRNNGLVTMFTML